MKMNSDSLLAKLLKEGKLKEQLTDVQSLNGLLDSARRNLQSAEYNLGGGFHETAFKAAYDGLLQISRVVLLLHGYRPDNGEQHKTTFLVAGALLGKEFEELIERIDRYRVKRHKAIYQPLDFISKSEAENALNTAKEYQRLVGAYLRKKNHQIELFN